MLFSSTYSLANEQASVLLREDSSSDDEDGDSGLVASLEQLNVGDKRKVVAKPPHSFKRASLRLPVTLVGQKRDAEEGSEEETDQKKVREITINPTIARMAIAQVMQHHADSIAELNKNMRLYCNKLL